MNQKKAFSWIVQMDNSTNITTLRRFAIGAIKAHSRDTVAATIQRLARNVCLVFDYLGMTENSRRRQQARLAPGG